MADNFKRKCLKCAISPQDDLDIKLFRFPKPGSTNMRRCEMWAKYCFPDEHWSLVDFQHKLYSEHRMLCNNHFKDSEFLNIENKKLFKHAVPDVNEFVKNQTESTIEPVPGPACVLKDIANKLFIKHQTTPNTESVPGPSGELIDISNKDSKGRSGRPLQKLGSTSTKPATGCEKQIAETKEKCAETNEPCAETNEPCAETNEPCAETNEPCTDTNEPVIETAVEVEGEELVQYDDCPFDADDEYVTQDNTKVVDDPHFSWNKLDVAIPVQDNDDTSLVPEGHAEIDSQVLSLYCESDEKTKTENEIKEDNNYQCNNCSEQITSVRYTCVQCLDYDLCPRCDAAGEHCAHYVLRVPPDKQPLEVREVILCIRRRFGFEGDANDSTLSDNISVKEETEDEPKSPVSMKLSDDDDEEDLLEDTVDELDEDTVEELDENSVLEDNVDELDEDTVEELDQHSVLEDNVDGLDEDAVLELYEAPISKDPLRFTGPMRSADPLHSTDPPNPTALLRSSSRLHSSVSKKPAGRLHITVPLYSTGSMTSTGPLYSTVPPNSTGPMTSTGPLHSTVPPNSTGPMTSTGPLHAAVPPNSTGPMRPTGPLHSTVPSNSTGHIRSKVPLHSKGPNKTAGPLDSTVPLRVTTGSLHSTGPMSKVPLHIPGPMRCTSPLNSTCPMGSSDTLHSKGYTADSPPSYKTRKRNYALRLEPEDRKIKRVILAKKKQ